MTAELVRGQNHPLSQSRLEIRISAGTPVAAAAALGDENGRIRGTQWVAHPGAPVQPGLEVSRQAAADHRLAVDLDAMTDAVHRVSVLLALPAANAGAGPARFGSVAAPFVAVTGLDGTEVASYTITGLDLESAVVALELYRRQGAWKVRRRPGLRGRTGRTLRRPGAVRGRAARGRHRRGRRQGPRPLRPGAPAPHPRGRPLPSGRGPAVGPDQGAAPQGALRPRAVGVRRAAGRADRDRADRSPPTAVRRTPRTLRRPRRLQPPRRQTSAPPPPPPAAPPAQPGQPARPVAGDATGWSMEERLYNQVWGMFEDLARTAAAYRSAVDFAESRMDKELEQALSDPRSRIGGQGDAAREAARARYTQLVDQARASLDRDLDQLVAESEVVEPALPPAFARWDNPCWHAYRVPMEIPMALRLGDLRLPEAESIRIPMLLRLPLERGLWIDSGRTDSLDGSFTDSHDMRRLAMDTAVAHAARLLAVYPAGEFTVHVVDPAGSGAQALAPLTQTGVLAGPPAQGAAGVTEVLARLTQRVDLVQMALRGGAPDALPPGFDTSQQLLIVNDFPHGFDDRAVNQLRYLVDEGPPVGVHLMMVADREESAGYGPLLDPLWRSLLRLTPVPDDHLADPWVGHAWTYEPPSVPPGSEVLRQVLTQVAEARRTWNR